MALDVREKLKEMGVVGAGGAGFPTYAKLKQEGIDFYIANGAECEPLLDVDKELMARHPEKVLRGLDHLREFTGAGTAVIALKGKYKKARHALEESLRESPLNIEIFIMGDYFPAGDEQSMVHDITGKVVPEGGIPLAVGAVVNNIETLFNVQAALDDDQPVVDKYITVGGDVKEPLTVKVPVGTKIRWLLEFLKIDYEGKIILDGGPMMGNIIDPDSPIIKSTGGILLFKKDHPAVTVKQSSLDYILKMAKISCIQCRYCTEQCPRYLLGHDLQPSKIMLTAGFRVSDEYLKQALLCCECGICEAYSCPQKLSPRRVNAAIRKELAKAGVRYTTNKTEFKPREALEWRKLPISRLKTRLQLNEFDRPALLMEGDFIKPKEVTIPTKQHAGAPAEPAVVSGEKVKRGQVIGRVSADKLGCNIHASINGTVIHADKDKIIIRGEE